MEISILLTRWQRGLSWKKTFGLNFWTNKLDTKKITARLFIMEIMSTAFS